MWFPCGHHVFETCNLSTIGKTTILKLAVLSQQSYMLCKTLFRALAKGKN